MQTQTPSKEKYTAKAQRQHATLSTRALNNVKFQNGLSDFGVSQQIQLQTLFVLTDLAAALRVKSRLPRVVHGFDAAAQGHRRRQLGKNGYQGNFAAPDKHEFATWRVMLRSLIEQ